MTAKHITAPDGSLWQLVPVEPTPEQIEAVAVANGGRLFNAHARAFYLAGLTAAPEFGGVAVDLESLAIAVHRGAVDHAYWRHRSGMDVDYFASILAGVQHAYACGHLAHPPAADEAMGRDAARYRWLRTCDLAGEQRVMTADGRELKTGNDLDAAIDAAMRGGESGE